jgi:nitroreductase
MDFGDVVRARRMVRSYSDRVVEPELVDRLIDLARRAPSAGNSQGWNFVVLEGPAQTAKLWDVTMPAPETRAAFRWQGLLTAPVIVLPIANRDAYTSRYSEPDKVRTGLGNAANWTVPYWQVDTAFATMTLLHAATDAGLGALFFGVFHRADELLASLGVPDGNELIGAIALGWPDDDEPGRSSDRPRRELTNVIHRGAW